LHLVGCNLELPHILVHVNTVCWW